MNGFGQIQLTEYNNFPGMMQVSQQPQQIETLDEKIDKARKQKGVSKTVFNEILARVKKAFGVEDDKNIGNNPDLVCKFTLKVGEGTIYKRIYDEPEDDLDFFDSIREEKEEKYHLDEGRSAQKIEKVILSLGGRSISYNSFDDKNRECTLCNNHGYYFAHEGSCDAYKLLGVQNAVNCTLCELKINHPEKINDLVCPVYSEINASSAKWFCKNFLVEVLYKLVSGLDFLDKNYVGEFNSDVTQHVRNRRDHSGECTICKKRGEKECRYGEAYPRYLLKKGIEREYEFWFRRYVDDEVPGYKEIKNSKTQDSLQKAEGYLKEHKEQLLKFKPIYKQCVGSLEAIVDNMVKMEIVTEKSK